MTDREQLMAPLMVLADEYKYCEPRVREECYDALADALRDALAQAEQDAYERAAEVCDDVNARLIYACAPLTDFGDGVSKGHNECAAAIRALAKAQK